MPAAAAVKQLRKNHLPGGKHRASEGRASSEILPLLHAAAATAAALAAGAAKLACLIPWRAPPCVCRGRRTYPLQLTSGLYWAFALLEPVGSSQYGYQPGTRPKFLLIIATDVCKQPELSRELFLSLSVFVPTFVGFELKKRLVLNS